MERNRNKPGREQKPGKESKRFSKPGTGSKGQFHSKAKKDHGDARFSEEDPSSRKRTYSKDKPFSKERKYSAKPDSSDRKSYAKEKPFSEGDPSSKRLTYSKDKPYPKEKTFSKGKPYSKERNDSDEKSESKERGFSKRTSYSKETPFSKNKPDSKPRPYHKGKTDSEEKSGSKNRSFSEKKPYSKERTGSEDKPGSRERRFSKSRPLSTRKRTTIEVTDEFPVSEAPIRLNRYLANAGICSRREADKLIQSGAVSINGEVVSELGTKVGPKDKVQFGGETLSREQPRYLLLNKPKDFLTTSDDPMNRRTVMNLIEHACKERIYPVGRLDRNTTGLLLFTNDGELAKNLMHPKFETKKIYHVYLDKNLTKNDLLTISEGLELEDGFIQPDSVAYVAQVEDKKQVGIELHSGKNRIVRRIFEHLGYEVVKLDRVFYAGLTKKDLPRGKWRFLTPKEIILLKRI